MSYPPRPPIVPYGIASNLVPMPLPTHVMVSGYGGRAGLLPAPSSNSSVIRPPPRPSNGKDEVAGVTVFIGNITPRAPDAMIRQLLGACGPVVSWKRVSAFGFCEFGTVESGLRCVRLLHERLLANDRELVARVDGKFQERVDEYKIEQRDKLNEANSGGGSSEDYLDARQKNLDEATERKLQLILKEYEEDMKNYEILQKEEQMEKTNRALEDADIEEEKRDVIHREIGKFRESMKVQIRP